MFVTMITMSPRLSPLILVRNRASKFKSALSCVVAVLTLSVVGCGESSNTVQVSGRVTYHEEPLTNAALTFFPQTGRPVTAPLSEQGKYAVPLSPGKYTVVVSVSTVLPPGFKEGDPMPEPGFVLPDEYTTRSKTKLTASVEPGARQSLDLKLE
jgi:hypothetical protein